MSVSVNTLGLPLSEDLERPIELLLLKPLLLCNNQLLSLLLRNRLPLQFKSSSESREYLVEWVISPLQELQILSQLREILMCLQPLLVLLDIIIDNWRDPKQRLLVVKSPHILSQVHFLILPFLKGDNSHTTYIVIIGPKGNFLGGCFQFL